MRVSIIMPCFKRMNYLDYSLWSLSQQKISYDIETIILNDYLSDSGADEICNKYKKKLNIKYFFIGQRHTKDKIIRRDQGFALNIGVKQAKGDIIILTGNGIFHLNNTINLIVNPLIDNKKILSIPKDMFFDRGKISDYLSKKLAKKLPANIFEMPYHPSWGRLEYTTKLPFWMGMYKQEFIDIGGHDEDFVGVCGLDDDLVDRLQLNGLIYLHCNAKIIHLYHPKSLSLKATRWGNKKWSYNTFLRLGRKGQIVRNIGKEWGRI